jgi:Helicase HerA, central domain
MNSICFRLDDIPDLSLAKYSSLDGQGVDAVLEKHLSFLRQFAATPGLSIHLWYAYDPTAVEGSRLAVYFAAIGADDALANIGQLLASSSLAAYFRLRQLGTGITDGIFTSDLPEGGTVAERLGRYRYAAALTKTASFVNPKPPHKDAPHGYFTVPEFEPQTDSRLYSMAKVMEGLNQPAIYRVDLHPSNRAINLRESLPLDFLRRRLDESTAARDYTAEGISKGYEALLERFDGSPHFNTNIFAFADSRETAQAILTAAGSEAVQKGSTTITFFAGDFGIASYLDPALPVPIESMDGNAVGRPYVDRTARPGYFFAPKRAAEYAHADITTLFTLEDAAAFFRFPALFDGEAIQLRKETAPLAVGAGKGLYLGRDEHEQQVQLPLGLLPKHAFISGMPGSGKTNLMLHLVSALKLEHGVPFLVLEPAKREYRSLLNQPGMEEVYLFSPAAQMRFPLRINPFQMPVGISVAEHISRLCQVFEGAFPLEGALPFLLDRAIETVYRDHGWTPKHIRHGGEELDWPTLSDLYRQLEAELAKSDYSGEVRGNLKSALQTRIGGLLRREQGEIFNVPESTIDASDWLHTSAVIELAGLGRLQANFLTLLMCVLIRESLSAEPVFNGGPVRHVLFIEEAHNVIGPTAEEVSGEQADPKQAATAFIRDMLAEVRALRQAIIIADQLPTAMAPEVIKNTGLKIGLRITSADDRQLLGSTMGANALQLEQMTTFEPGSGLISYEGLLRPFRFRTKEWRGEGGDDFIADVAERRIAQTPLPDGPLFERVEASTWFQHSRDRSVTVDLMILHQRLTSFLTQVKPFIDVMEVRQASLRALEALLIEQQQNPAAGEALAAKLDQTESRAGDDTRNAQEGLARLGYAEVGGVIRELDELLDDLESKRRDWTHLGFGSLADPRTLKLEPEAGVASEAWVANQYLRLKRIILKTKLEVIQSSYGFGTIGNPATHPATASKWLALVDEFTDRHGLPRAIGGS